MKWMTYLQQFNLVIKYKRGVLNKLTDMLFRPPIAFLCLSIFVEVLPSEQEELTALYATDLNLKTLLEEVKKGVPSKFVQK